MIRNNRFQTDVFDRAFRGEIELSIQNKPVRFSSHPMADLILPSGRVAACEEPGLPPFAIRVAPGSYPTFICNAEWVRYPNIASKYNREVRTVFSMVRFSDEPAVEWELAAIEGIDDPKRWCYGVDGGMGCFTSPECDKAFDDDWYESTTHFDDYSLYVNNAGTRILFPSGLGDGEYFSYWGFDASGRPAQLITDYKVLLWKSGSMEIIDFSGGGKFKLP